VTGKVVHCKKSPYDVYIGQPGQWGNPFATGPDCDRNQAIKLYEQWIRSQPELMKRAREKLKGKVLGCFCAPKSCHGDILLRITQECDCECHRWDAKFMHAMACCEPE
jgi:Domain of unknown function (DUF4326)